MKNAISVSFKVAGLAVAGVFVGACASAPKPAAETALVPAETAMTAPGVARQDTGTAGVVNVDQRVVDMCKLPEPHFAFDSAALSPQG
jgi:hypothetical protein